MATRLIPPLASLRAFEAAARLGRFNAAAEALGVTESAVSHQVRKLEDLLHVRLFERDGRSVSLTDAGARYHARITPALDELARATEALAGASPRDRVALTLPASLASAWLIPRLADFEARCPNVDLQLVTTPRLVDLRAEQVDLALRYGTGPWPGVDAEFLLAETAMPVCRPGLVADDADVATVLATQRLVVNSFFPEEWREWSKARGVEAPPLDDALRFDSTEQALAAAEGGLGVALGRSPVVEIYLARGTLVAPFGGMRLSTAGVHLCAPAGVTLSASAWRVREWLLEVADRGVSTEAVMPAAGAPRLGDA